MADNPPYNQSILTKEPLANKLTEIKLTVVVVVTVLTLASNQLIIYAFFKNFKMRTITNTLVINLCIADVISVICDLFFYSVELFHDQLFGQFVFCRVSLFINQSLTNAVVMAMMTIAIDRYFNLVNTSLRRWSRKHVRLIVDYVWIHAFGASLPWDLVFSTSTDKALTTCAILPHHYQPAMNTKVLSYILRIITVIIPYLVIIYIFILVGFSTRRRRQINVQDSAIVNTQVPKTERFSVQSYGRSTVSAFLLFSSFISVTLPFFVTVMLSMVTDRRWLTNTAEFLVFFAFRLQGIILPIVYLIRNRFIAEYIYRKIPFCSSHFRRRKENVELAEFPTGNTRNKAFVLSKSNSRLVKQVNRIKIFYTANELSTKFTDIGQVTENRDESKGVINKQVIERDSDVLTGNLEFNVHKWIYRRETSECI